MTPTTHAAPTRCKYCHNTLLGLEQLGDTCNGCRDVQTTTHTLIELVECSHCGWLFDPATADYDTGDTPVCDSCVIAAHAFEPDQDYMVFDHGVALF